ncbi:ferrochelatase, partial [Dehalococcoidia bacterium]|nr:ferrochelatase [Dehalococcoidia bacterium]
EALARLPGTRDQVAVLFSTHSMPKIVVEREPEYTEMLHDTAREVAVRANLKPSQWQLAYQSAAHTPEEWLKPDITDVFPELAGQGHEDVLIVPVQFLADHLEVLYDIDIAARAQAGSFGLRLHRTESFNVMPKFIEALANVVRKELTRDKQQIVSIPNLEGARDEKSRG